MPKNIYPRLKSDRLQRAIIAGCLALISPLGHAKICENPLSKVATWIRDQSETLLDKAIYAKENRLIEKLAKKDPRLSTHWKEIPLQTRKIISSHLPVSAFKQATIKRHLRQLIYKTYRKRNGLSDADILHQSILILGAASAYLEAAGIDHEVIEQEASSVLVISPGAKKHLNRFSRGLAHHLHGLKIAYDPFFLFSKKAGAGFNSQNNIVILPHASIIHLSGRDDAVFHELVHALNRFKKMNRINLPVHGEAFLSGSSKKEDVLPGEGSKYGQMLSFDELSAYSLSLRLELNFLIRTLLRRQRISLDVLIDLIEYSKEISSRMERILEHLELALSIQKQHLSELGKWISLKPIDTLLTYSLHEFGLKFVAEKNITYACLGLRQSGGEYRVEIPLLNSHGSEDSLNMEYLESQLDLLNEAAEHFKNLVETNENYLSALLKKNNYDKQLTILRVLDHLNQKQSPFPSSHISENRSGD